MRCSSLPWVRARRVPWLLGLLVWRRGGATVDVSPTPCQVLSGIFMTTLCRKYYPHFIEQTKALLADATAHQWWAWGPRPL